MATPTFYTHTPIIEFKIGRTRQTAQAWYVDGEKLFVNWGGEPREVRPIGITTPLSPDELETLAEHARDRTGIPGFKEHWSLAARGLLTISDGRYGLYSKITAKGQALLDGGPVKGRSRTPRGTAAGASDAGNNGPVVHQGTVTLPAAENVRASPRQVRSRGSTRQKRAEPAAVAVTGVPPTSPVKQGATSTASAPPPSTRIEPPPTVSSPARRRRAPRAAAVRSPPSHSVTPNAVRVTVGKTVTYYPLSSYDSIRNGEKVRVLTLNKLFRATTLEASRTDVLVL